MSTDSHLVFRPLQLCLEVFRAYNKLLTIHPYTTKSITSAIIGAAGATVSSILKKKDSAREWEDKGASQKPDVDKKAVFAFALFGLIFQGPLAHMFYTNVDYLAGGAITKKSSPGLLLRKILIERFLWAPSFLLLTLFWLEIFQGHGYESAINVIKSRYWTSLKANWKIWTLPQLLNLSIVPVQLRVLVANSVAFVWSIYLASKAQVKIE